MEEPQVSIEEQLIRYRIEKTMAGRRDLLLHGVVYVGVAVILLLDQPWLQNNWSGLTLLGGYWTIPLILHGLRYYYRCGPGAARRADEIERAIDEQLERRALDEDEEVLIEERVGKRITARRLVVAHGMASALLFAMFIWNLMPDPFFYGDSVYRVAAAFLLAFALHFSRFFFVHGRMPLGRALKIDAEVEREWHRSREREGRAGYEAADGEGRTVALEVGDGRGGRLRLNDEGEFERLADESVDSARAGMGRA